MSNNFGIFRLFSCHSSMKLIFFLPYCKKNTANILHIIILVFIFASENICVYKSKTKKYVGICLKEHK